VTPERSGTIAGFVFTRCQTVCPLITLRMRKLQEQTRGTPVKLVSFSVDPQHDTPEVLAAYAGKAGAEPARWRFVTGDPPSPPGGPGMLKMSMDPDGTLQPNGVPNVVHTEHLALIDKSGRVRGYYDSSDDERLARLRDDLSALLAE
jgi:protein SCO1/2